MSVSQPYENGQGPGKRLRATNAGFDAEKLSSWLCKFCVKSEEARLPQTECPVQQRHEYQQLIVGPPWNNSRSLARVVKSCGVLMQEINMQASAMFRVTQQTKPKPMVKNLGRRRAGIPLTELPKLLTKLCRSYAVVLRFVTYGLNSCITR